jgi:hypothetical protein
VFCRVRAQYADARTDPQTALYGSLLCMSTMRIGADALLFSRSGNTVCCAMLSQSLQERAAQIDKNVVVTPFAVWAVLDNGRFAPMGDHATHTANCAAILENSPFTSTALLLSQFQNVSSPQGNVVVCYNLWPCEPGLGATPGPAGSPAKLELCPVDGDIVLRTAPVPDTSPRRSLRQYLSILFLTPPIRLAVEGVRVRSCHPYRELHSTRRYTVVTDRFSAAKSQVCCVWLCCMCGCVVCCVWVCCVGVVCVCVGGGGGFLQWHVWVVKNISTANSRGRQHANSVSAAHSHSYVFHAHSISIWQLLGALRRQNEVSEALRIAEAKLRAYDLNAANAATASVHGEVVRAKIELGSVERDVRELRSRVAGTCTLASTHSSSHTIPARKLCATHCFFSPAVFAHHRINSRFRLQRPLLP